MNYYNPYIYNTSPGLFKSIFGSGASFGTFLSNTQKLISTINQAMPAIKQVTPIIKNAKTMFSVMNEFKKIDKPQTNQRNTFNNQLTTKSTNNINYNNKINEPIISSGPNFFI